MMPAAVEGGVFRNAMRTEKKQTREEGRPCNAIRARKKINESDGEGFLADRRGAERPNVLDVHDLFATKRADKKTSQMAHLFSDEP
jgi:hypothetical protein